jgi:hypothetical protein
MSSEYTAAMADVRIQKSISNEAKAKDFMTAAVVQGLWNPGLNSNQYFFAQNPGTKSV